MLHVLPVEPSERGEVLTLPNTQSRAEIPLDGECVTGPRDREANEECSAMAGLNSCLLELRLSCDANSRRR
jgi:hypothetical protein